MRERRRLDRLPVDLSLYEIVDDEPHASLAVDLSPHGVYLERPAVERVRESASRSGLVQIDLPLPGYFDSIWASGEVVYDEQGPLYHGTAVRFRSMARKHRRALEDWVVEGRLRRARLSAWGVSEPSGLDRLCARRGTIAPTAEPRTPWWISSVSPFETR